jgi:beta-glucanase (GH16 family)
VLAFEDDFNGNSLDFSKWDIPYQGVIRDFNHTNEKQWYANTGNSPSLPHGSNIEVSNGTLKLIARKEASPVTGTWVTDWSINPPLTQTSTFEYTSAEIDSKKSFGYGKYEIRCKIPSGNGFWPAFWMYGEGVNGRNNEIDVFEFWENSTSDHNMTVHFDGGMCLTDYNGPDYSQNFHIFTVIWDNYKIEWYVDGQLKRRSTKFYNMLSQQVDCNSLQAWQPYMMDKIYPQDNMKIIANLALENDANYHPDATTPFPSTLEIDYIRYYKKIPCTGNVVASSNSQLSLSNDLYNVIVGTSITFGGNVFIQNGQQLELIARDEINLNPGFTADNGSNFVARIDPSACSGSFKMARANGQNEPNSEISYILVPSSSAEEESIAQNQLDDRLNSDEFNFDVKAFPNPTNEILNLEIRSDVIGKYSVVLNDMNGQVLFNPKSLNSNKICIDMTPYPSGIYILQVIDVESKKSYLTEVFKE